MSNEVNVGHVKQYASRVEALVQQRGSKLMRTCTMHSFQGKNAQMIQQVGEVDATEITDRHADTELINTPHDARWMRPRNFGVADMVDEEDLEKMIIDPKSPYATVQQYALGRKWDDIIIEGATGNSLVGEDGTTSRTFAADQGTVVPTSGTGLTVAKLRIAKRTLMANEVDIDNDELWCVITAAQHDDLLGQTQVVSGDFNRPVFATDGKIERFFGINFVHCERLVTNASSERRVLLWAKSKMHCGQWNSIRTRVRERADKWDNTQIATKGAFGASRSEGKGVVEIPCVES